MRNLYLLIVCSIIFSDVSAQQQPPAIEWSKLYGGTGGDRASAIVRTVDNGFLIVGYTSSNNGDVTGNHGGRDGWVIKISAAGNLQWQKAFGGIGDDEFKAVTATSDGHYVLLGNTSSNDGDVSGNHGDYDLWVVKIDRNGNLLWQKTLGGSRGESAGNIREFSDGTLAIIGTTNSEDGDVSGVHPAIPSTPVPYSDIWVVRLNSNTGAITFAKCFGGNHTDIGQDIIESDNGGYIVSGQTNSSEADLGFSTAQTPTVVVVKLNASNTFVWRIFEGRTHKAYLARSGDKVFASFMLENCYPQIGIRVATKVFTDGASQPFPNSINTFGNCVMSTGYNPYTMEGPGGFAQLNAQQNVNVFNSNLPAGFPGFHGDYDGLIASASMTNTQNWKLSLGGSAEDKLTGIVALNETEFMVIGYSSSNDGDVSGNHGGDDLWIAKLGQVNLIKGTVFADHNSNGTKDTNEPFVNNVLVQSSKGSAQSTSSTFTGLFANQVDTGTYTTKVLTSLPYYTPVPVSLNSTFSTYNSIDSLSFALQPIPGKRDYAVFTNAVTALRPGFDVDYAVTYRNEGTDTLTNRVVKFIKDGRLQFLSASPAQTAISGDTITWMIGSLPPRASAFIIVHLKAAAPPTLNNGDTLSVKAIIDTTGDLNKANNIAMLRQRMTGAYDPNDKQEVHGDTLYKHEYDAGDYLTYTIRFQNTGTDTAFNIVVKDTLSNRLDSTTLEMIGASHAYTLTIKDGKYCAWTFSNILLADSNVNEPLSHGYITYRIKPKSGLLMHDAILNSASIYFDFNEPVKTNTQQTALKPTPVTLPPQPTITGMQTSYCKNLPAQKAKITNLPAAASGITISVDLDDEPVSVAADSTFTFNVNTLSPGQHVIQVMYINSAGSKVAALVFTVTAALTPDVDATANITNVTNLTLPVVITAANTAGGGATPLYTFAKDRAFANILQAEGTGSTYTIDANNLIIGNNWFYVRMKTSETCITTSTNTDSINIRRDQSTGIVDIDNPTQTINIYPNPFKSQITIGGLSAQKKYIVTVTNLQGQQLYNKKVSNRSSLELPAIQGAGGIYWLTIYDETRKRSLGSVKLMKE
jgi:uncharacterized repeat protein (TIGR01451 family)